MAPKRVEDSMGELVEEIPPHHETAESPNSTASATSRNSGSRTQPQQTRYGFELPEGEFNFSGWRHATSVLQQRHPNFSGCITASATLHCWQPKQTGVSTSEALLPLILQLAVQLNRRAWEDSVPSSPSYREASTTTLVIKDQLLPL